jgi:hypothetical protein
MPPMTTIPTQTLAPVSRVGRKEPAAVSLFRGNLKRERIVHDLSDEEKHCSDCRICGHR